MTTISGDARNFINGALVDASDGRTLDNVEPATGQVYGQIARSNADDVGNAIASAGAAFPAWSRTPAAERSRIMLRVADALEERLEEFAEAESRDTGKPISVARTVDIPRAIKNVRFFATAIIHEQTEAQITDHDAINYTSRRPLGVCGLISPWNLPLYLFTWKVAPAIATGNTAVAKPSELTPVTASMFAALARDVGLPDGVLNVVHGLGPEAGAPLTTHPDVKAVSFTGGTTTGREIARVAGPSFKKLALEMGGKNPTIVFADADLEAALDGAARSAFSNQGQICLCGSRIIVERSIYDTFIDGLVQRARARTIGDPLDPATEHGALVSAAHRDKVLSYIDLAVTEGGALAAGGTDAPNVPDRCTGGYFVSPTVVTGLPPDCRTNQEEIFGPVVTVAPFDDADEAVAIANGTEYGLASSLWTSDVNTAHAIADRIETGIVWVNCWMLRDLRVPFGGMKQSGVGREGGTDALRFFTEPKNVCVAVKY